MLSARTRGDIAIRRVRTPCGRSPGHVIVGLRNRHSTRIGFTAAGSRAGLWLCLSLAAVAWSQPAIAWGDYGHKIICEIAFQELETTARERVKVLIRLDPEFRYFSDSCVWPDHPRQRAKEHFINLPRSVLSVNDTNCPLSDQCLFTAIEDELQLLSDSKSSNRQSLAALKFLGHWVGDIHQPLHVAFEDDRGGNAVRVDGHPELSLHKVWDREIIASGLKGKVRQIAAKLRDEIGSADRSAWLRTGTAHWAQESYAIATSPTLGYCFRREGACWYGPGTPKYSYGKEQRTIRVDERYLGTHLPTVIERLKMAGVRLGYLLNDAF